MKCVVITPIGPGHETLAKECQATVERAWASDRGIFGAMEHLMVDDTQGRLGRSEARNRAVSHALAAGADWIFFLDADDGMLPGAFCSVAPFLAQNDAVWGSIVEMRPGQTSYQLRVPQIMTLGSFAELLLHDPYHTLQMGHFVRTSVASQFPFHTGMNTGEDFEYYLRIWRNHRCAKVREAFFVNRRGMHSSGPRSADGTQWRVVVERLLSETRVKAGVIPQSEEARAVVNAKTLEYRDWIRAQGIAAQNVPFLALSSVFPFHGAWRVDCYQNVPFTLVSENDDPVVRAILWTGTFEPEGMKVWLRLAREAAQIVDVGSFSGLYGLAAAAQYPQTPVSFVHPLPASRLRIEGNLRANAFLQSPQIFSDLTEAGLTGGVENSGRLLVGLDTHFAGEETFRGMEAVLAAAAPDVLVHGEGAEGWGPYSEIFATRGYHFYRIGQGGEVEASDRFGHTGEGKTATFLLTLKSLQEVRLLVRGH